MKLSPCIALLAVLTIAGCSDRELKLTASPRLTVTEVKKGSGNPAKVGDRVTAKYTLALPDGTVIVDITGGDSHTWILGDSSVIVGLDESVIGMKPRAVRRVLVPPALHYGRKGYANGLIPPRTTLTLEVELAAVN